MLKDEAAALAKKYSSFALAGRHAETKRAVVPSSPKGKQGRLRRKESRKDGNGSEWQKSQAGERRDFNAPQKKKEMQSTKGTKRIKREGKGAGIKNDVK